MATNFTFGDSFLNAYIGAQQRAQQQKQFDDEMNYRREQAKTAVEQFNKRFGLDSRSQEFTENTTNRAWNHGLAREKINDSRYVDETAYNRGQDAIKNKMASRQLASTEGYLNIARNKEQREAGAFQRVNDFYGAYGDLLSTPTTTTATNMNPSGLPTFWGLEYNPKGLSGLLLEGVFGVDGKYPEPREMKIASGIKSKKLSDLINKYPELALSPQGQSLLTSVLTDIDTQTPEVALDQNSAGAYLRMLRALAQQQQEAQNAKDK